MERLIRHREPWPVRAFYSSCLARMVAKTRGWAAPRPPESIPPKEWRGRVAPKKKGEGIAFAALDDKVFGPVMGYYDLVIGDLSSRCSAVRAKLILVHLVPPPQNPWPARDQAQAKLRTHLEAISARYGVRFFDTTDLFSGRTEWILPGDGHFNPDGNRALASFLVGNVLEKPVSPGDQSGDAGAVALGHGDDADQ